MTFEALIGFLDFDPRMLGIEVLEDNVWSTDIWDKVLQTGRRCLGFAVPDWGIEATKNYKGFNMLLVNNPDEHSCLKSYRDGSFIGSEYNKGLMFDKISLKGNNLSVDLNQKANIKLISDKGIELQIRNEDRLNYKIPQDEEKMPDVKYLRVEAESDEMGRIFSQPIRFSRV